jgi:hypothetical protein
VAKFFSADARNALENQKIKLQKEISSLTKSYLDGVNDAELIDHLLDKYKILTPSLKPQEMTIINHGDTTVPAGRYRDTYFARNPNVQIPASFVTVSIPFDGDQQCFYLSPSRFDSSGPPIDGELTYDTLTLTVLSPNPDAAQIRTEIDRLIGHFSRWLQYVELNVKQYNTELPQLARAALTNRRQQLGNHTSMISGLNIPVELKTRASSTVTVPLRKKPLAINRPDAKESSPDPKIADAAYDDILAIMHNMALVMERSPKAFEMINEEALRFHFLVHLNGHFEGQASGETFNSQGKTDILIRHENQNIFIAECKFWSGPKMLIETIDQLLSYTTWRDTKTAVVVFNRNKGFTKVLSSIEETIKQHPRLIGAVTKKSDTHLRTTLKHPNDDQKIIHVAVLAFDVPTSGGVKLHA